MKHQIKTNLNLKGGIYQRAKEYSLILLQKREAILVVKQQRTRALLLSERIVEYPEYFNYKEVNTYNPKSQCIS